MGKIERKRSVAKKKAWEKSKISLLFGRTNITMSSSWKVFSKMNEKKGRVQNWKVIFLIMENIILYNINIIFQD